MVLPGASPALAARYAAAAAAVLAHPAHAMQFRSAAVERVMEEDRQAAAIDKLDFQLSNNSLALLPDYGFKLNMLKEVAFVSAEEVRCLLVSSAVHLALMAPCLRTECRPRSQKRQCRHRRRST